MPLFRKTTLRNKTIVFTLCLAALIAGRFVELNTLYGKMPPTQNRNRMPRDIMVFAPHNDDETLAAGGVIRETLKRRGRVRVELLTNGDGFRVAEAIVFKNIRTKPRDLIDFGYVRQSETVAAMRELGLPESRIDFLGYPDRGLGAFWTDNWSPASLYTSKYTRSDRSPYRNSFRLGAPYCGASVIDDVKTLLVRYRPRLIFVPHSMDAHPDHRAAHNLVLYALEELRRDDPDIANRIHVATYLVHRGSWPRQRGYHPHVPLLPPRTLERIGIAWWSYPLEPESAERKIRAIRLYRTQMRVMSRFLVSFARPDELFADWPLVRSAAVPQGGFGNAKDVAAEWDGVRAGSRDPVEDTILRDVETGADLKAVYFAHDKQSFFIRAETTRNVRPTVVYQFRLKPIEPVKDSERRPQIDIEISKLSQMSAQYTFTNRYQKLIHVNVASHITFRKYKNNIEVVIPRALLGGADRVFLDTATLYRDRVPIDYHLAGPILINGVKKP